MSQVSHSVALFQNQTSGEEADKAAKGDNWHLREARRQKENDAGDDINIERRQQYTKRFIQSSKGQEIKQQFESETFPGTQTRVCSYWEAGDCAKGEHCQFLHDPKVITPPSFISL